jgi:hypothetical protein
MRLKNDPVWRRISELIWQFDFAALGDDRTEIPGEYDSLSAKVYSAWRNGLSVGDAIERLDRELESSWSIQLSWRERRNLTTVLSELWAATPASGSAD